MTTSGEPTGRAGAQGPLAGGSSAGGSSAGGALAGEVALVTGAGSGIGAASARRLAAEGAAVAVTDLAEASAARVRDEIVAAGGRAVALALDVADEAAVRDCVERVVAELGPIGVLHNNAAATALSGGGGDAEVLTMTAELWDATMAVNVRGPMLLARAVLPAMIAAGRGSIVNTSSGAAAAAEHLRPAYGASKAALESLTRSIATRYGPVGVRCNAIAPGLVLTDTVRGPGRGLRRMRAVFAAHTPSPLGTPDEVARVVAFLASDAARYVNGVVLRVDGGMGAAQPYLADLLGRHAAVEDAPTVNS
ncbi:SDR family NAD(P)-dependent oxidoreductase [Frankia sp. ACN1ag]|uniref:SDR family NAD(P)-dependent oxidoreductase n=1 Tax=Frankia sp. ACN1ag TaxID=102891 RepID=UPI001F263BF4|nr:SDR family NAD(P)-dependent oxidoreductase [Frankia sp. ACN1ag]